MIRRLLMWMAMSSCIVSVFADTYRAAVVNLRSGTSVNYSLDGVSISVSQGNVVVESPQATAQWPLGEVESFQVKDVDIEESTSVDDVRNFYVVYSGQDQILRVSHYSGQVDFYLTDGRLVKSVHVKESASILMDELPQGAYVCVFRSNGQTIKIITK